MTRGQILIVDDDAVFVDLYREILEGEGHQVQAAATLAVARETLAREGASFDVVLIDQKLQGPGGPDSGLELIKTARTHAPFAKTLVVTGYSSPQAIEAAFEAGVYDYLVKNGAFEALLKAKVRNAVEVTSERRIASLRAAELTAELRTTWASVLQETNPQRKGALLEQVMKLLFKSIEGFEQVTTNFLTASEEIDVVVMNRSLDPLWSKEGQYLFGECKNWSKVVGSSEAQSFLYKLLSRPERVRVGLFFSVSGFSEPFLSTIRSHRPELVLTFGAPEIAAWIEAPDRLAFLTQRHQQAVVGAR
jgi:CheY-like chemotaxis protein